MKNAAVTLILSTAIALVGGPVWSGGISPDPLQLVSPSRPYKTTHTRLDLDIDLVGQRIGGSVTHTMRLLRGGVDEIRLNCVELEVESVLIDGREVAFDYPVPGERSSSWFGAQEAPRADDMLVVRPGASLGGATEFELTVKYHGTPQKGLYWIAPEKGLPAKRYEVWSQGEGEDNRYWIPCHDYPNDKATFEGRFRVDKGYYVLSNGDLISQNDNGGKTEFYWRLEQPQVSYLIMIAAAKYKVIEEKWNDIQLLYVVPPGTDEATVERTYGVTADMMDFFSRTIGIDYPFGKYAQVVVQNFIYGGMENSSATTMNMRTLHDERAELTRSEHGLVAHELAHQWWGDMVTCREWSHLWLNEGFATYYQQLYREYREGEDAFRYEMSRRHKQVVERDDRDPRPVVVDFFNRKDNRNNSNIYIKGASVLHMLRFILGDELYHATIKHYGETHKFDVAETSDLARAVKDVTGENLDWFFEQWIYLAGHPKLKVTKEWNAAGKVLKIGVRQTQDTEGLAPLFRLPVDIEITCKESTTLHSVVIDEELQDFYFNLPSSPEMVILDKGDWILKDLDFPKLSGELLYQLENGDYMSRVRAATALGKKRASKDVTAALGRTLMDDGHWGLRREAALALGRVQSAEALDAIVAGLSAKDARVRLACAEALAEFRANEEAAGHLIVAMRKDPAYGVRARAVTSLVTMRSEKASSACHEALKQESDRSIVRNAGLNGLAELKETKALAAIKRYCTPGNDRDHRHEALAAYARLAKRIDEERDREKAADFIAEMLDDWYLRTREAAIGALQTLREPSSVSHLRRVATNDPLARVRNRARRAADRIESASGDKESVVDVKDRVKRLEEKLDRLADELDEVRKGGP